MTILAIGCVLGFVGMWSFMRPTSNPKLTRFQLEAVDTWNTGGEALNLAGRSVVTGLQCICEVTNYWLEKLHGWLQPSSGYDGQLHVEKQVEKCVTGVGRN